MSDKIFRVKLKALSPVPITKRVFGILYETYQFIPAWTIWNTFVKLYAIEKFKNGKIDYESAKNKFKKIRLTNFYIFTGNGILRVIPEDKKKEYVFSDFKTAIDALSGSSLDKALYEREYLIAKNFIGWVKVPDELNDFFQNELKGKIVFIGADKNTGFGKVVVKEIEKVSSQELVNQNDNETEKRKIIKALKDTAIDQDNYLIPAEIENENLSNKQDIFPLVLRQWNENGSGMCIRYIRI